jgi:hypothetical protein
MSKQSDTANVPAAKTFAPSREDVLSTLSFFFGDPATPEKLKDYSEHRKPHHSPRHLRMQLSRLLCCACRCDDVPLSGRFLWPEQ